MIGRPRTRRTNVPQLHWYQGVWGFSVVSTS